MKIKTKIAVGIGSLFVVMLAILILNNYYIRLLANDARDVIKDNQISLDHVQNMQYSLALLHSIDASNKTTATEYAKVTDSFESNLFAALDNVTEKGEGESLKQLKYSYSLFKRHHLLSHTILDLKAQKDSANSYYIKTNQLLHNIYELNRNAILMKNQKAVNTASEGVKLTNIIGTLFTIIAFTFIFNFPGYIANPIKELSEKIHAIADRSFNQRLDFTSNDEFGTLAKSFNYMAQQLNEYQKSTLSDLLIEKKRVESIINNLDEGICLLDAQLNIIIANPAMGRLMNIHELELIGKPVSVITEKNASFKNIFDDLQPGASTKPPISIIMNNEELFFDLQVQPVYTFDEWKKTNQLSGYVVFLKNVTEFKKQNIAKTNFLANVSHELKTPLSSINLSLKLLHDKRVGELSIEQEHLVNNINHESQRLLKFVNELLEYAKNETGNVRLTLEKTFPLKIIQFSLDAIKPTLEQAEIHTQIEIGDNLPHVLADVEKTVWVLTNLIGNAVRYGPPKETITIGAEKRHNDVVFTVKDRGKGIDPKYHTRIFQRFAQLNQDNKNAGTGLGLAIAKDFIEAQNGKIWVESEPGHGSTFSFTLQSAQ